jgi:hypothetical protein
MGPIAAGRQREARRLGRVLGLLCGLCLLAPQLAVARTAYVVNESEGTLTPINTATNVPGVAIKVGGVPYGIA